MNSPKKAITGDQLKKGRASTPVSPQPNKHQIELWLSYKNRTEAGTQLDKAAGEIWSTNAAPVHPSHVTIKTKTPHLVLILDSDGEVLFHKGVSYHKILIAPISTEIELATQWDFIVQTDASPLGYPFMIEVWNKTTMLSENLERGLARLDDRYRDHVQRLAQAETANLLDDSPLDPEMFRNNIGTGIADAGNEIFHFQHKEIQELEYLLQPVKALTAAISEGTSEERQKVLESLKRNLPKSAQILHVDPQPIPQRERKIQDSYQQFMAGIPHE